MAAREHLHPDRRRTPGTSLISGVLRFVFGSGRRLALVITANLLLSAGLFVLFEGADYFTALWWAVTTGTTVGYGDVSPVGAPGRVVGMWLMLSMVASVAMATAMLAAWLVQDPHLFSHDEQEELKEDVDDVHAMLHAICEHLGLEVPSVEAPGVEVPSVEVPGPAKERN